jgi:hypothetical protein
MARRRKRSRFEFGGDLEGLLERPDPQTEKAQAEDEKTQDGHPGAEHAGAGGPHERLLELQKTAGNRAVGAVLDRLAHDAAHAAPAGGGGWPRDKQILFDGTRGAASGRRSPTSSAGRARSAWCSRTAGG